MAILRDILLALNGLAVGVNAMILVFIGPSWWTWTAVAFNIFAIIYMTVTEAYVRANQAPSS